MRPPEEGRRAGSALLLGVGLVAAGWKLLPGPPRPVPVPEPAPAGDLVLHLTARTRDVRALAWPLLEARIVNRGREARTVLLPGLGSSWGLRTPTLAWSVRPVEAGSGQPERFHVPTHQPLRCGNIPAPRVEERVTLAPGESVRLDLDLSGLVLARPGRYRLALEYRNAPGADWTDWRLAAGEPQNPAWQLVSGTEDLRLVSNPVEVVVHLTDRSHEV